MELLERYLQAARFWLPKAQQNDIIEELRDDLSSQIEEKESSLGRELTEDETAAILKHAGHPMRVAARYQKQQSLVGPALFPVYQFVLKIVMIGYAIPWFVVWIIMTIVASFGASSHVLARISSWGSLFTNLFIVFGIVTLLFAVLERFQSKLPFLNEWDPRKLPRVQTPPQRKVVSRMESIFGLIFSFIFIAWWLSLPSFGHYLLGPAGSFLSMNPALLAYHLPILLPTLVIMAHQCINIFRPQWTWLKPSLMLVSDVIAFVIVQAITQHYPYFVISSAAHDAHYAQAELAINQVFLWSMVSALIAIVIALIVHAYQTVKAFRRLRKDKRQMPVQVSQLL